MVFWLVAAAAYLAVAFVASAMTVRFVPHHAVSRQLRRRLAIFPFVPLVLLAAALAIPIAGAVRTARLLRRPFEVLSGRRQFSRFHYNSYGYEYGSSRRKPKSPPPAAASGATTSRPMVRVQTLRADAQALPAIGQSPRDILPGRSGLAPLVDAGMRSDSTRLPDSAHPTSHKIDA